MPESIDWQRLSDLVADTLGLHFPPARWPELRRGLAGLADELGIDSLQGCADVLLGADLSRAERHRLASHLTIGETYFCRESHTLDAIRRHHLPALIDARRGRDPHLNLWSAGCCSGEEPYTLAILLHEQLPDIADWRIRIVATDINLRFLRKASAGVYGAWSFRDTPEGFRERWFNPVDRNRFALRPEVQRLVTFEAHNLAQPNYPLALGAPGNLDLILCRNVLMYFEPAQMARAVERLHRALGPDGWLAVSPCETSAVAFSGFEPQNFPGAVLYRKPRAGSHSDVLTAGSPIESPPPGMTVSSPTAPIAPPADSSASDITQAVVPAHRSEPANVSADQPSALDAARTLADQGRLDEARQVSERWVAAHKLDPAGHYLLASVLIECGAGAQARAALKRALYLQPELVMAHVTLGTLARAVDTADAKRHFAAALRLLDRLPPGQAIPHAGQLDAEQLRHVVTRLIGSERRA